MAASYTYEEAIKSQRESQKKFDYFFLGVVLALLGFSVESFDPSPHDKCIWLVPLGWSFLIISLLAGLYRQECINFFLYNEVGKIQHGSSAELFKRAAEGKETIVKDEHYTPWSPEEIKQKNNLYEETMGILDSRIDKMNKRALYGYKVNKWAFVLGIYCLVSFKILKVFY